MMVTWLLMTSPTLLDLAQCCQGTLSQLNPQPPLWPLQFQLHYQLEVQTATLKWTSVLGHKILAIISTGLGIEGGLLQQTLVPPLTTPSRQVCDLNWEATK